MTHKINDKINFKADVEGKGVIIAVESPRGYGKPTYIVAESEEASTYKWHPEAHYSQKYNRMVVLLKAYQIL